MAVCDIESRYTRSFLVSFYGGKSAYLVASTPTINGRPIVGLIHVWRKLFFVYPTIWKTPYGARIVHVPLFERRDQCDGFMTSRAYK